MVGTLASAPCCARLDSQPSQVFFGGKIINVAQVNQQRRLEESEQWLENVDQTYLVRGTGLWQASTTKKLT